MLKIKDEIDLKELEKFGFVEEKSEYSYGYYFNVIEEDGARIAICKPNMITSLHKFQHDREIYFDYSPLYDDSEFEEMLNKYENIIYDLIQAGLVEKIGE